MLSFSFTKVVNMIKKNIFIPLDREIRLNYSGIAEVARQLGITRQSLKGTMTKLEKEVGLNIKTLENLCNILGYEIIVRKKEE